MPDSGVVLLRRRDKEGSDVAFSNLLAFLATRFDAGVPQLLVKEEPLNLAAIMGARTSMAAVRFTYGLHAVVEGVCVRFGVPWSDVPAATVRKHFTSRGRGGSREASKAMVIARCHQLGYMDRDDADDDRADACAVWDWACAHLALRPPRELVLFPPAAAEPAR